MAVVVLNADARAIPLPDRSVQCVITSPPYWGLRDYGHAGQIGLEKTPEDYVASICQVFEEIWRVLRDDGTCWLNLGDSYVSSPRGNKPGDYSTASLTNPQRQDQIARPHGGSALRASRTSAREGKQLGIARHVSGVKTKDLVGIPWRVAFALQAAGWYLRSDIIWAKPNPMPESVTDRPTRSHEYLFLLTKREKYYYDSHAIREAVTSNDPRNHRQAPKRTGGIRSSDPVTYGLTRGNVNQPGSHWLGRNRRSVWSITTKPYSGAHFATFPPDLVEPCLLAGTPEQSCADCGAPCRRIIERGPERREQQIACGSNGDGQYHGQATKDFASANAQDASATKARILAGMVEKRTVGWSATCHCAPAYTAPAIVLDPFGGSGTVGVVATAHGRDAFVIDRKFDYCQLAVDRQRNRKPARERERETSRRDMDGGTQGLMNGISEGVDG